MDSIANLFNQYGYIILTLSLILELLALPLPGQTIMTYCGYKIHQENMSWFFGITMAFLGVVIGITISYFIGKTLGRPFFEKYGHYVHLSKDKLNKITKYFQKYGFLLIFVSYFIPGLRHLIGYFSGITKLSTKRFILSAYLGALLWTTTFICFGGIISKI